MRTLFWIGVILTLIYAFHLLSSILLPFLVGAALAFFLDPAVGRLERWKVPRAIGTTAVLIAAAIVVVALVLLLVPLLEAQFTQLVQRFPTYVTFGKTEIDSLLQLMQDQLSPDDMSKLQDAADEKLKELLGGLGDLLSSLLSGGVAVANVLSLIFITPIVTFFLLRDWHEIMATLDSWMPRQHVQTIREQARLIHEALSGFLRGQATVCLLLGCFYAIGLTLLGLDFALVVGLCVGLLIFIPFLGGLTGAVLAVGLAFAQFGDWHRPLYVAILFIIGQTLEGNVITPKLVGDQIHLHPVWVIFSLLAFGVLFGFAGVLIAVPMAAALGVLIRFALKCYLGSGLYDPDNGQRIDGPL